MKTPFFTSTQPWATKPSQTNSKSSTENDAPPSPVFPRALNPKVDQSSREATPGGEASGKLNIENHLSHPENFERMLNVLSPQQKGAFQKERIVFQPPSFFKGKHVSFWAV